MKRIFALLILITMTTSAYAVGVSNNITVLQNLNNASQCPANYRGSAYPTTPTGAQPWGPKTGTANQVYQSCTGCYYQQATRSCVCQTCFGGY